MEKVQTNRATKHTKPQTDWSSMVKLSV